MSELAAIFLYTEKAAPPRSAAAAVVGIEGALEGDRHFGKRAILAVDQSVLEELGLQPGALREQLSFRGFPELDSLPVGSRIAIGEGVFEITKSCAPCLTIGEYNGVSDPEVFRDSLQGRRGMFLSASSGTRIAVGDPVRVLDQV